MARKLPSLPPKSLRGELRPGVPAWVIFGFDLRTFEWYIPTPGVFTEEPQANEFVRRFSSQEKGIVYAIRKTVVGKFDLPKKRRR